MKVTEQIDAMRALGTDPTQKLVTPQTDCDRHYAASADRNRGLCRPGWLLPDCEAAAGSDNFGVLVTAWRALEWNDLLQGLLKPFVYALVISLVGCFYGIRTTGGTQGVGRATTQAVVVSIVWIFVLNVLITKTFVNVGQQRSVSCDSNTSRCRSAMTNILRSRTSASM